MRFLADENFPFVAVEELRAAGFDAVWIRQAAPGITDREVLAMAASENRILLTQDKDFGELAFHEGLPSSSGVMLFRLPGYGPARLAKTILAAVKAVENPSGLFTVVEPSRIRMRPIRKSG